MWNFVTLIQKKKKSVCGYRIRIEFHFERVDFVNYTRRKEEEKKMKGK